MKALKVSPLVLGWLYNNLYYNATYISIRYISEIFSTSYPEVYITATLVLSFLYSYTPSLVVFCLDWFPIFKVCPLIPLYGTTTLRFVSQSFFFFYFSFDEFPFSMEIILNCSVWHLSKSSDFPGFSSITTKSELFLYLIYNHFIYHKVSFTYCALTCPCLILYFCLLKSYWSPKLEYWFYL